MGKAAARRNDGAVCSRSLPNFQRLEGPRPTRRNILNPQAQREATLKSAKLADLTPAPIEDPSDLTGLVPATRGKSKSDTRVVFGLPSVTVRNPCNPIKGLRRLRSCANRVTLRSLRNFECATLRSCANRCIAGVSLISRRLVAQPSFVRYAGCATLRAGCAFFGKVAQAGFTVIWPIRPPR
jgi:hypothetical protein